MKFKKKLNRYQTQLKLKKAEAKRQHEVINKLNITISQHPLTPEQRDYSFILQATPKMEIAKNDAYSEHYRILLSLYCTEGRKLNLKTLYLCGFNGLAGVFGLLYFAYQGLFFGSFVLLCGLFALLNTLEGLGIYLNGVSQALLLHLSCCASANLFMIHKACRTLEKCNKSRKTLSEHAILTKLYRRTVLWRKWKFPFVIVWQFFIINGLFILSHWEKLSTVLADWLAKMGA